MCPPSNLAASRTPQTNLPLIRSRPLLDVSSIRHPNRQGPILEWPANYSICGALLHIISGVLSGNVPCRPISLLLDLNHTNLRVVRSWRQHLAEIDQIAKEVEEKKASIQPSLFAPVFKISSVNTLSLDISATIEIRLG